MTCTCSRIKVGITTTESRNWNPDCPEHGTESDWYRSDEQVAKRAADSARIRDMWRQVRDARRGIRS